MKIINNLHRLVFVGLVAALFSGCASMQSMSSYARTGDTISVALGGTEDSNALVEILKKEDIAITITDSASVTHTVTLRKLFRVYPDYSSEYIYESNSVGGGNSGDAMSSYTPPLLGQWIAVIDLVEPVTLIAPALAVGPATLAATSVAQIDQSVLYNQFAWENGDLGAVQIEIIAGQGSSNTLNYAGPVSYDPVKTIEPLPQIIVAPSAVPAVEIGGGSFTFVYTNVDFGTRLKAVPANHDPNVQLMSSHLDLGNGSSELKVTLLNPNGFLTTNQSVPGVTEVEIGGSSPFRSARFNLIWRPAKQSRPVSIVTDLNWQNSIQMTSGSYIDLAGNTVTGITPVMKKTR